MKNLFVFFALLAILASCNQEAKKTGDTESTKEKVTAKAVTVAEVLATPENYNEADIKITGMVTHVCKHGGQKLFIIDEDPEKQIRIDVGEGIPEFDIALEGSTVEFTGKVTIMEADATAALEKENEEKDHHTGDEAHAEAESASYSITATSFKEIEIEVE